MKISAAVMTFAISVLLAIPASVQEDDPPAQGQILKAFGNLPIYFIENRRVYPEAVKLYVQGADKTLFFTRQGITFLLKDGDRGWAVKMEFVDANPDVTPRGECRQEAIFNHFRGPEKDWKTGLETYGRVVYEDLWPGIDLVYRGTVNQLKYEFVVDPGADPAQISLRYRGAASVELTGAGALRVVTPAGSFEDAPPVAYQEADGERVEVALNYSLVPMRKERTARFRFDVGPYDPTRPLILDPTILVYCGYIGGAAFDAGYGIAVDSSGTVYVTGETRSSSTSFPVKTGPVLQHRGQDDAFVARVKADGTGLVYCGYIGGMGDDYCYDIAVDGQGNAYVTGETDSDQNSFPVLMGPSKIYKGATDAFVAKVNPQGQLVYCGYIGGIRYDEGEDIVVDARGNAYVTGDTQSDQNTFPVLVGPSLIHNDRPGWVWGDAFVAKVNPQGQLVYCGYIGGTGVDDGDGIAVDESGQAYVTGGTTSTQVSFPVNGGPDLTYNGGGDAYVAKVKANGSGLVYCGYIGGSQVEDGGAVQVDTAGNLFVVGETQSNAGQEQFPVKRGPDLTFNGGTDDAFVARLDPLGQFVYCGYIGGAGTDLGWGIALDAAGNAIVTGMTSSRQTSFPVKVGPGLTYNGGVDDAFVARVNPQGTGLDFCGYLGGADSDQGEDIEMDAAGNMFLVGSTNSGNTSFPVTGGPGLTYNKYTDAFVAKIALVLLSGQGTFKVNSTVSLTLTATDSAGLPYQVGSSLGKGPIPIDSRRLGLSLDTLLVAAVSNWWPGVFSGYAGTILNGQASARIHIPAIPVLAGTTIHSAFVTLDSASPSSIRSISNTSSFTILP